MSEHYFSEKPQSIQAPTTWAYQLRNKSYTFTSNSGVFSKKTIDFGTELLINTFEKPNVKGDLLDVGCGYGPIGITLGSSFKDNKIVMLDVNTRAIALTKENVIRNEISNAEIFQSNGLESVMNRKFAAIVTNPPIRAGKEIIYHMFEDAYEVLLSKGELWIVIQKKQGGPSAKNKLLNLFGQVEEMAREKGYFIYKAVKD